jgi:hypothetical protein
MVLTAEMRRRNRFTQIRKPAVKALLATALIHIRVLVN